MESKMSGGMIFASSRMINTASPCKPSIFSGLSGDAASARPCRNRIWLFIISVRDEKGGRPIFSQSSTMDHLFISGHKYSVS